MMKLLVTIINATLHTCFSSTAISKAIYKLIQLSKVFKSTVIVLLSNVIHGAFQMTTSHTEAYYTFFCKWQHNFITTVDSSSLTKNLAKNNNW